MRLDLDVRRGRHGAVVRHPPVLESSDIIADRIFHQIGYCMQIKLIHDALAMDIDRSGAGL